MEHHLLDAAGINLISQYRNKRCLYLLFAGNEDSNILASLNALIRVLYNVYVAVAESSELTETKRRAFRRDVLKQLKRASIHYTIIHNMHALCIVCTYIIGIYANMLLS